MIEITERMNSYRECSRNLWNVYFSGCEDIGGSLDAFEQIRLLLFEILVLRELLPEGDEKGDDTAKPALMVVPLGNSLILVKRLSGLGEAGYWDQEKNMVVGPADVTLEFIDYFDFSEIPIKDFRYYRCRVMKFAKHAEYEGREALMEVSGSGVFYDELAPSERDIHHS